MKFIILSYNRENTINLLASMQRYPNINVRNRNMYIIGKENTTGLETNICDIENDVYDLLYSIRDLTVDSLETVCLLSDKYIFTGNPDGCSNYVGRVLRAKDDTVCFSYSNGTPDTLSENIGSLFNYKRHESEPFFSFGGFVYRPADLEGMLSIYTSTISRSSGLEAVEKSINSQHIVSATHPYNMTFREPCLKRIAE